MSLLFIVLVGNLVLPTLTVLKSKILDIECMATVEDTGMNHLNK